MTRKPCVRIVIDKKQKHEPQQALTSAVTTLRPDQVVEPFELVRRYEAALQEMRAVEEKDKSRRLRRVYSLLPGLANRAEAKESGTSNEV